MTGFVCISTLVGVIGYDVYAVYRGGIKNTISWFIWSNSLRFPIIPFGAGVLAGHLFWQMGCI